MTKPQLVTAGFSALAANYDAAFCDIWGVVHNGVAPHPSAVDALTRYREEGGKVILVTNASRPGPQVAQMLDDMGITDKVFDSIVSSGDVTRDLVRAYSGHIIHMVGPRMDHPLLDGLKIALGEPDEAAAVLVTGLDAYGETPDDYRDRLKTWLDHRLPMICANPDITVEVGDTMEYCAGALAEIYADMGGKVEMAGKPHPPIYDVAFKRLAEVAGPGLDRRRIVAIGDAARTDALGAARFGIDFLFITGSLHAAELNAFEGAEEEKVIEAVAPSQVHLVGYMPRLAW